MATKKTIKLGIVLVIALTASMLLESVGAIEPKWDKSEPGQYTTASKRPVNSVSATIVSDMTFGAVQFQTNSNGGDLDTESVLNVDLTPYIEEYEALPEDQRIRGRCLWVVVARGSSWETEHTTDSVESRIPMGVRFFARPVMDTEDGVLFRVPRGIVGHEGERHRVEGYGWARKEDGVFYIKLDGEEIRLKAVGKVYPRNVDASNSRWSRSHRVAMKGRLTVGGDNYNFALRGRAFRVCLRPAEKSVEPSDSA